ncbi:hypothetical protein NFI96_032086, partial [Prochilodus magdalenae]
RRDAQFHTLISSITRHPFFDALTVFITILDMAVIALTVEYISPGMYKVPEKVFLFLYALEFSLKVYAEPRGFWKSGLNVLSTALLLVSLVAVFIEGATSFLNFSPVYALRAVKIIIYIPSVLDQFPQCRPVLLCRSGLTSVPLGVKGPGCRFAGRVEKFLLQHFCTLTGIELESRLRESLAGKGKRVLEYFKSQLLKWKKEVKTVLYHIERHMGCVDLGLAAILVMIAYFKEREDAIFLLADEISTEADIEAQISLPSTPRLIIHW